MSFSGPAWQCFDLSIFRCNLRMANWLLYKSARWAITKHTWISKGDNHVQRNIDGEKTYKSPRFRALLQSDSVWAKSCNEWSPFLIWSKYAAMAVFASSFERVISFWRQLDGLRLSRCLTSRWAHLIWPSFFCLMSTILSISKVAHWDPMWMDFLHLLSIALSNRKSEPLRWSPKIRNSAQQIEL